MSKTLTKTDIISAIQIENGYYFKQYTELVKTLLQIIKSTLSSGEDFLISGFGKFQERDKRERRGRNPTTDDDMILPSRMGYHVQVFWEVEGQGECGMSGKLDFSQT